MVILMFIMQVQQVVQRRTNLRKISFVAHSLGGLVARYAIGKLYEPSMSEVYCLDSDNICDEQKIPDAGKIAGLEPINFITSATPHLGSRLNKQVSFSAIYLYTVVHSQYSFFVCLALRLTIAPCKPWVF
jgi:hypothetical protein